MPSTYNGCGTWYYGKRNVQSYQGQCRSCKRVVTLTSYDTRLWVVAFLVPVIPLGRKRIIEKCSACTRHMAMPLKLYQVAAERGAAVIGEYRGKPNDAGLAKEVLTTCATIRDLPLFLSVAPSIELNQAGDVQTLLMLGAVYHTFGRAADEERVVRAAFALRDDDETREALADCLLRQGKPGEAEPYLGHIVEKGIPDRVGLLYSLAQGYQIAGDHERALAAFDWCAQVNPASAKDPMYERLRGASEEQLAKGSRAAVSPAKVAAKAKRAAAGRKFAKVAPVVLGLAAATYLVIAVIMGARRTIYLVNGLDRPYTARINGKEYALGARAVTPARIGEGELKVEILGAPAGVPAETVSVHSGLLTRPFDSDAFVINPDATAVIRRTKFYYVNEGARGAHDRQPESEIMVGRTGMHFTGVDYPFEAPPKSIEMGSETPEVAKVSLSVVHPGREMPGQYLLAYLSDAVGQAAVVNAAKRHVLLEPGSGDYLFDLERFMGAGELADFLRPGLAERPVRMEWHRAYQTAMDKAGKGQEVEREYEAMMAASPDDADITYLAGRAAVDAGKRVALYERATTGAHPCAYAFYSLCGEYLCEGRFHEAAMAGERAAALLPKDDATRWYARMAMIADGQLDRALEMAQAEEAGSLAVMAAGFADEAYVRTLRGDAAGSRDAIARLRGRARSVATEEALGLKRIEASLAYVDGDLGPARAMATTKDPDDRLMALLCGAGTPEAAEAELANVKAAKEGEWPLLVYLAAKRAGRAEAANKALAAAVGIYAGGDSDDRAVAAALSDGGESPPVDRILGVRARPEEKAVILAAVGTKNAAAREACFALARRLNYDRRFPHRLIEEVVGEGAAPATQAAANQRDH